jgi:hypothetical protein
MMGEFFFFSARRDATRRAARTLAAPTRQLPARPARSHAHPPRSLHAQFPTPLHTPIPPLSPPPPKKTNSRLTDSQGRTVSFKQAVIICTSNLGSAGIFEAAGDKQKARAAALAAMRARIKPEVQNRLDEIIVFDPLEKDQIRSIVGLQVKRLADRLAPKKVRLQLTDAALDRLADVGYDPVYGARPVKRAIQRELENPLAKALLRGEFGAGAGGGGDDELELDAGEGEAAQRAAAAAMMTATAGDDEDELVVVDVGGPDGGLVFRASPLGGSSGSSSSKKAPLAGAAA